MEAYPHPNRPSNASIDRPGWRLANIRCEILNACHHVSEISAFFFSLFPFRSSGREASKAGLGAPCNVMQPETQGCFLGSTPHLPVPAANPGQSELGHNPEKMEMLSAFVTSCATSTEMSQQVFPLCLLSNEGWTHAEAEENSTCRWNFFLSSSWSYSPSQKSTFLKVNTCYAAELGSRVFIGTHPIFLPIDILLLIWLLKDFCQHSFH